MLEAEEGKQSEGMRLTFGLQEGSSKALVDLAWAEWETIQRKIDSVSTFPFTIKTWAVAITAALLGIGKGLNFPPESLFSAAVVPVLFWAIEGKHYRMREILGRRALQLEALIGRLAPIEKNIDLTLPKPLLRSVKRLPGVALAIQRAEDERNRDRYSFRRPEGVNGNAWAARNVRVLWQKYPVKYADGIFYCCQLISVLGIASSLTFFPKAPSVPQTPVSFAYPLLSPSSPSPGRNLGKGDFVNPTPSLTPLPEILKEFPESDLNTIFNADKQVLRTNKTPTIAATATPK